MIIVHIVEPFAAGIAVFVKSLTEAMPADMHIVIHGERKKEMLASEVKKSFPRNNVRFIRWRSAQRNIDLFKDVLAFTELYKILNRLKKKNLVDAVHLHSSKSGLLGRAACRMAGISNVFYTPNGASFLSGGSGLKRYIYRQLERVGNRFGGSVVCCSESELEEYLKLGINADYINNGVSFKPQSNTEVEDRSEKFRIVTSGRVEKQKNPHLFNEIAAYFEEMSQFEFIWIGDGKDKQEFTSKNVKVTGWLGNKEVQQYVANSNLYISTSNYEGLSFAVLEALALKKPVLLSNCTGNTDLVKNGVNGGLFNTSYEAIVKILQYHNNREMLEVMGSYSGEICRAEFDMKQNFKSYRDLYAGAIRPAGNGPVKWSLGY